MKKMLMVFLAVCLMTASVAAAPADDADATEVESTAGEVVEIIDLSPFTDEEIVALLNQVQAEIAARNIEKTALLHAGTYIGGKDIPAGSYVLSSAGAEDQAGIVSLRSVNDPEDDWPSKLYEFTNAENGYSVFITVEIGDTLILPFPDNLTISGGAMVN